MQNYKHFTEAMMECFMPKTCTVQYRQLKTEDLWPGVDLKAMLVDVLKRTKQGTGEKYSDYAKHRVLDLDQDKSFVILNKISSPDTWDSPVFCGQLIHVQEGSEVQAVIQELDEDTEEFVLHNLDVGEKARVLRGALYFAVAGNHVGLIEGHEVRGRTLERYLTMLLQLSGELDPGKAVILNGSFLAADGKELKETDEITISAKPNQGPAVGGAEEILDREFGRAREDGKTVFDVLAALGWGPEAIARLEEEVPPGGWVEGVFKFFIKQKRKRRPISRATVNEALRNIDPADLGMRGEGREKNGLVKLATQRKVATVGSLIEPVDAMLQIVEALKGWSVDGKIDCKFD